MTGDRLPGRPRSESTRRAIEAAALDELRERGYAGLTIEGIAARAGAGKQTIYRWWRSKADVVLDAMAGFADAIVPIPDKGSLPDDLLAFLVASFRQQGTRPALAGLMAQAVFDPEFAEAFRERFISVRRTALRGILQRAAARGEIAEDVDLELLVDVAFGVLWYRLLLDHAPLDDATARDLAALMARAAAPERRD
ncbi:TetR/AcrR family transcriptional regulator [Pseudonocardia sp. DLS-67]